MAKTKKLTKKEELPAGVLSPQQVHELFGLSGPYEPPPPAITTKGYTTWWDPGISIRELARKHRALFSLPDLLDATLAKGTDSWKWRQLRQTPVEPNLTFPEQQAKLKRGDDPAFARELVAFLVLHFLTTGERLEMNRWRCRDVFPSGRRAIVGPFGSLGLEIANVSDEWKSPGICLSVMSTPRREK